MNSSREQYLNDDRSRFAGPDFRGRGPRSYKRSDRRIYEEVCEVLMASPDVDPSDVSVTVAEGVLTLEGTVDSRATK